MTRYSANDDFFYSDLRVPRNKYNIKDEAFLDAVETYLLSEAYSSVLKMKNFINKYMKASEKGVLQKNYAPMSEIIMSQLSHK